MPDKLFDERLRAAERHGMIAGGLAVGEDPRAAAELAVSVVGEEAPGRALAFASESLDGLRAGNPELPAILLDEALPLATRLELFGSFARGFLSGIGQAGERLAALDADGMEMLRDVELLSRGAAPAGDAQADEEAYRELLDYLCFAAMYFYRELA